MTRKSVERIKAESRTGKRKVFISYRSDYIEKLNALIKNYESEYEFIILKPGTIAYEKEILTRLRRWQLMSILDRYIERVDEFWVYDTQDYTDSWWTQGELITLAYRKYAASYCPEIKTFNPNKIKPLSSGYAKMPELTENQVKQIARLYSNSDPLTMGPESTRHIKIMRKIADIPIIGRAFYWMIEKTARSQSVKDGIKKYMPISVISSGEISEDDILSQYADREFMKQYLHDEVWENSFSENSILEIGQKECGNKAINVDSFIQLKGFEYKEFTPSQVEEYVNTRYYSYGNLKYSVEKAAPRYLWFANRRGNREINNLHVWDTILFNNAD